MTLAAAPSNNLTKTPPLPEKRPKILSLMGHPCPLTTFTCNSKKPSREFTSSSSTPLMKSVIRNSINGKKCYLTTMRLIWALGATLLKKGVVPLKNDRHQMPALTLLRRKNPELRKLPLSLSKTLNIQLLMILYHPGIMGQGRLQNLKRKTFFKNKLLRSYWKKLLREREVMQSL